MHVILLPLSKEANNEVALELSVENLGEEVEVGDKSGLEDDGDVGGVKELDGVGLSVSLHLSAAHGDFDSETLLKVGLVFESKSIFNMKESDI